MYLEFFAVIGFLAAAGILTGITWNARNKSTLELLLRGFIVLGIGGFFGTIWAAALHELRAGIPDTIVYIISFLGQLTLMYTAILSSTLVRAAWSDGRNRR